MCQKNPLAERKSILRIEILAMIRFHICKAQARELPGQSSSPGTLFAHQLTGDTEEAVACRDKIKHIPSIGSIDRVVNS